MSISAKKYFNLLVTCLELIKPREEDISDHDG